MWDERNFVKEEIGFLYPRVMLMKEDIDSGRMGMNMGTDYYKAMEVYAESVSLLLKMFAQYEGENKRWTPMSSSLEEIMTDLIGDDLETEEEELEPEVKTKKIDPKKEGKKNKKKNSPKKVDNDDYDNFLDC